MCRRAVLTLAGNRLVSRFVTRYGMRLGNSRFLAGETLGQAIETVKSLNRDGLLVTLDHLGESVTTREEALEATQSALDIFDAIAESGVDFNVSVKLTSWGSTSIMIFLGKHGADRPESQGKRKLCADRHGGLPEGESHHRHLQNPAG